MSDEATLIVDSRNRSAAIQNKILQWAEKYLRIFPWRIRRTPYKILVAEFLLKRTTATAVNRIYEKFISLYPNLESLRIEKNHNLEEILKTLGYNKRRTIELKKTANYIIDNFSGKIPMNYNELLSIPNIGHYTAGAIISLGHGKPASMVDSNVERILTRVFKNSIPEKAVMAALRNSADILVPKEKHDVFNFALLDLGALICKYRNPNCEKCPLIDFCDTGREDN